MKRHTLGLSAEGRGGSTGGTSGSSSSGGARRNYSGGSSSGGSSSCSSIRGCCSSGSTYKVEADLQQLPQGTQRTQALARFRSQRHMHSIGMAFLNEPMYSTTASFDGLSWQLAVKRAIGEEEQTAGCKLCGKSPGGTLHARLCQAPRVKAHDTIVHNSVKRATQRILRQYLKTGLVDEDYTPFLGSAGPPGSRRMDIVLPADAFPVTGYDDPTRHLPLMVDVTCFEAQIGEQGRKLLEAVATEYASRMSVPGGARPKALKGIALARLRSALSAALHMAYSGRVMTHMAESRGGGHMEEDVGEDPEMPFGGGGTREPSTPWSMLFASPRKCKVLGLGLAVGAGWPAVVVRAAREAAAARSAGQGVAGTGTGAGVAGAPGGVPGPLHESGGKKVPMAYAMNIAHVCC
ncbi:hypothetical protein JKP88DRAFT_275406 [Tribonema minus]|uniref:Uncharacterized protein n=1 Tax=Tribonema minus TaxID=303371 RepID=A0A836CK89_9STRA|nr:hypothetical protein JKP88DRAFT_275406 [Tribonema minus]